MKQTKQIHFALEMTKSFCFWLLLLFILLIQIKRLKLCIAVACDDVAAMAKSRLLLLVLNGEIYEARTH